MCGKGGCTDIVLKYKPGGVYNGEIFFTRKKKYALDFCAVCDFSTRFICTFAAWLNSQHDARVYASTNLQRHPENYFSPGEYLLGDTAYKNSSHLVSPYKSLQMRKKIGGLIENHLGFVLKLNMRLVFLKADGGA